MRQQLKLASEPKSNLLDTVDWGNKRLVDFDGEKNNLDSFGLSNNSGPFFVKMNRSVFVKKNRFLIYWESLFLVN